MVTQTETQRSQQDLTVRLSLKAADAAALLSGMVAASKVISLQGLTLSPAAGWIRLPIPAGPSSPSSVADSLAS